MKNIFKDACFGKAYKTRGGKKAIEECDKLLKDEIFIYNGTEYVAFSDVEKCWKPYCYRGILI